ncbi:MAG: heme ABC transporter permease [Nevskiales bacterium]
MWTVIKTAFHQLGSPPTFYWLAGKLIPWLALVTAGLMSWGLYGGLALAPADYQQGEGFRIIYVHVPSAWLSLFVYVTMAVAGMVALIWRMKVAEVWITGSAPLGASFTFLALVTGSLWGKPMWGTYWVWDARLTSELVLLFLYFGIIALNAAIEDPRSAARACALLAIVGVINIPIIHYSVEWWYTLHQGPILADPAKPSVHPDMLWPLLLMTLAFNFFYFTLVLVRMRTELLERERSSRWVEDVLG